MSAERRAALEALQAEVKTLDGELADWPEVSAERRELEARLTVLEAQRVESSKRADALQEALRAMRLEIDRMRPGGIRSHWWQSGLAVPAIIAGFIGAVQLTSWALDHYSWPSLGDHYGVPVLLAPVAINGARVAWQVFWRARRLRARGASSPP